MPTLRRETRPIPEAPRRRGRLLVCLAAPFLGAMAIEFAVASLGIAPAESSAPMYFWNPSRDAEMFGGAGDFQFARGWLWEPRPGAEIDGYRINKDAYAGPAYPTERRAPLRIAVLAESGGFGHGVGEGRAWPRRLEGLLRHHGVPVEVLNFSATGHTVAQGLALFEGKVAGYRPDIVIASYGVVNEHYPSPGDRSDRERIAYSSSFVFDADQFLRRYATYRWMLTRREQDTHADRHRRWKERAAARLPRVGVAEYGELIVTLRDQVDAAGGDFLFVVPPRGDDVAEHFPKSVPYADEARRLQEAEGVAVVDVLEYFERQRNGAVVRGTPFEELGDAGWMLDRWHPNETGHVVFATLVAMVLARDGLVSLPSDLVLPEPLALAIAERAADRDMTNEESR